MRRDITLQDAIVFMHAIANQRDEAMEIVKLLCVPKKGKTAKRVEELWGQIQGLDYGIVNHFRYPNT